MLTGFKIIYIIDSEVTLLTSVVNFLHKFVIMHEKLSKDDNKLFTTIIIISLYSSLTDWLSPPGLPQSRPTWGPSHTPGGPWTVAPWEELCQHPEKKQSNYIYFMVTFIITIFSPTYSLNQVSKCNLPEATWSFLYS